MKTMKAVLKYHGIILARTSNQKPVAVKSIKFIDGERDSFNYALDDLVISGMVMYTSLNPVLMIKRIA